MTDDVVKSAALNWDFEGDFEGFEDAVTPMLRKYDAAMREMCTRLESLDADLETSFKRNPIRNIENRRKSIKSIYEKMLRRGYPVTLASVDEHLWDIAGVRVIASYVGDVYILAQFLLAQDDLEIVTVKDYVADPKPNGYRSLHVVVKVPTYFLDQKLMVPVEVQFRTIAMDFWASLEHTLKYKGAAEVTGIDMAGELKYCATMIEEVEERMQIMMDAVQTTEEAAIAAAGEAAGPEQLSLPVDA